MNKTSTELKEPPQTTIYPCPRCINGQILAINANVCFQCGYEIPIVINEGVVEGASDMNLFTELRRKHNYPCRETERVICPKCGKEVCLSNQTENKAIKPHKDPATEGSFPRPWCDMSGEEYSIGVK